MVRSQSFHESLVREVDFVPPSAVLSSGLAKLFLFEDNEAVIKMCLKGRSPALRHVSRTHRVNLDWLIERIKIDPGIQMKYVGTNQQLADMLTKASFTVQKWDGMLKMHQIGKPGKPMPDKFIRKNEGHLQISRSAVLAQRETALFHSASSLDFAPCCLCAMTSSSSKDDWKPPEPTVPPPQFAQPPPISAMDTAPSVGASAWTGGLAVDRYSCAGGAGV